MSNSSVHIKNLVARKPSKAKVTYRRLGVFLPVDARDMMAEEMGDTLVDDQFDSCCASRNIRR